MVPGLQLATFLSMFPQYANVTTATVNGYICLINNGYQFVSQCVTDVPTLQPYYYLLAHMVAVSTNPISNTTAGNAGSYMPTNTSAGLVSMGFQQLETMVADQAFMLSTWYGQIFWMFTKQQYVQNFYLQGGYL